MNCVPWQRGRHPVTGESWGSESRAGHEGAHHGPIWGLGGGSAAGCTTVEAVGTEPSQIIPAEPKSGQGSLGANLHFIFYCMGAPYCPADGQHHRTAVLHTATVTPWHCSVYACRTPGRGAVWAGRHFQKPKEGPLCHQELPPTQEAT